MIVKSGEDLTTLKSYERAGYNFIDWYTDGDLAVAVEIWQVQS